jgi:hypothetical protein
MAHPTKESILEKVEDTKRELLDLSQKALEIADALESIHLEYSTKDGTDEY